MTTMIRMMLGRELLRQPFFLSAAASSSHRSLTGLADFFEEGRDPKGDQNVTYGRSWKASELRNKSWEDLHQLWYVMLKEKNLLLSQRQMLLSQNYRMPNPERVPKVNLLLLWSSPQVCFFM
jgi:large subunit ribosomal protein L47